MAFLGILRGLLRDRANLFQSFLQPLLLAWILSASLGANFSVDISSSDTLRAFYLSFLASEFYAVVILLVTLMVASQYATDMAVQCAGPTGALGRPVQYRSSLVSGLSIGAGVVLLVCASMLFFLAISGLLLGVSWPWNSSGFWILLGGLLFLSVSGGFALGLVTRNRGLSDLVITVIVFGSALGAGAFFPYPETSRVWTLAPYNPFTLLLVRLLSLKRGSAPTPGGVEQIVWITAFVLIAIGLGQLRWRMTHCRPNVRRVGIAWLYRERAAILSGLALTLLSVAIWLAGPADFVPGGVSDTAGFMYPYAGLATVLSLLLHILLIVPLVDGSVVLRNKRWFRRRFLLQRAGVGAGLILLSVVVAGVVWRIPGATLLYTAVALGLFQFWSLGLMLLLSEASKDRTVYWALTVTVTLLITFLGGSFWRPSLFGWFGHAISYFLPNGLLLHHRALPALLIVSVQTILLFTASSPDLRRRLSRGRRSPPPVFAAVPEHDAHPAPEGSHGDVVGAQRGLGWDMDCPPCRPCSPTLVEAFSSITFGGQRVLR